MGMYLNLHLGPFLIITMKKEDISEDIKTCSNESCNQHGKVLTTSWCSNCGSTQGVTSKIIKKYPVNLNNLLSETMQEKLWEIYNLRNEKKNEFIVVSNRTNPKSINLDEEDSVSIISEDQKIKDLNWFHQQHSEELNKLGEIFGAENVILEWGILKYHN